jgi:hypothetical protein
VYPEAACKRTCEAYDWRSLCRKAFIWYIISSWLGGAKFASGGFSQAARAEYINPFSPDADLYIELLDEKAEFQST